MLHASSMGYNGPPCIFRKRVVAQSCVAGSEARNIPGYSAPSNCLLLGHMASRSSAARKLGPLSTVAESLSEFSYRSESLQSTLFVSDLLIFSL